MPALTRLSGLGVAALSLAASVHAAGSGHGAASHPDISKRQSANTVTGASGQTQPRLEIRQLEQDADQWNLFMLAMQDFQNTDHSQTMSWYQIAGIHGMPYVPWNGVQGGNQGTGYCPHTSPLFICWHRPYVALWEQQMLASAQNVVNQFQGADKTRYQNALSTLRHPYWDWAEVPPSGNSADAMPQSMTNQTITVNAPNGQQQIPNPLYAFTKMNPHDQSDFTGVGGGDWDSWGSTLRYPSSTGANAQSNEGSAVQAIGDYNAQARAQVYRVLTACPNFMDMSNDGVAEQTSSCGVSLESIHNGIHTFTGGQNQPGHMSYNNFAAFDPAFFLHHANVDRLFAMWQSLNPNNYMTSASQGGSATFTINANQQVDANTPLEPFHGSNGQAWTCNSIRDVTTFHYTYPELQAGNVAQAVNSLYGSNAVPQKLSSSSASSSPTNSATSNSGSRSGSNSASSTNTAAGASGSNSASSTGGRGGQGSSSGLGSGTGRNNGPSSTSGRNGFSSGNNGPSSSDNGRGGFSTNRNSATSIFNSRSDTAAAPGASGSSAASASGGAGVTTASGSTPSGSSGVDNGNSPGSGNGGVSGSNGNNNGGGELGSPGSIIGGQQVSGGATTAPSPGLFSSTVGGSPTSAGASSGNAPFPSATGGSFPQLGGGNSTGNSSNSNLPGLLTPTGRTHDYTCHIVSEKHGLGGTYTIFGFLTNNTVPDSPDQWLTHPDFCGAHSVFAPLGVENKPGMLVGGTICLTTALVGKVASGEIPSIEENDVLPYLQSNLQWKVATAAGVAVPNNQVPGLTVGAVSQKVMPAANQGTLPTYGNGNTNNDVTHGKSGGIQGGMQYNWWDVCGAAPQQSQAASSY